MNVITDHLIKADSLFISDRWVTIMKFNVLVKWGPLCVVADRYPHQMPTVSMRIGWEPSIEMDRHAMERVARRPTRYDL